MKLRCAGICLTLLITTGLIAAAEEPTDPPAPNEAAKAIAGEEVQGKRMSAVPVLAGHVYALPVLTEGLSSDCATIRARCALLLGKIRCQETVPALAEALDDADRTVRMFAGIALARMGDERGTASAAAALQGPRWWIRFHGVTALQYIATERALGLIEPALRDPDPLVRDAAAFAIENPGPAEVIEARYSGPEDLSLEDTIFELANYLIAETDWWWHAGDYRQLLRGTETIAWLDPTWEEGFAQAGYLYWSLGRNVEAVSAYRKGVDLHPDSWLMNWELGFYYFNAQKRFEDAIPLFERARELGSPPVKSRMHAHALERAERPQEALEVWYELHEEFGEDGVVRQNIERLEARLSRSGA